MTDKRKLKEGTISYRKCDGRYMGRYRDNDGTCRCVYGKTYSECLTKLNDALAYRDRYLSHIKFHVWLDDWVENFKRPNIKPSSLAALEYAIRLHIKKGLPNKPLVEINGLELQKFLVSLSDTPRTRETVMNILGESFRQAFALRLIDFNPMLAVKIPTHKRKKGKALTDEELAKLISALDGRALKSYFLFCVYTGCRRNEALSVRWEDIDFGHRVLHIRGTKTELSDRYIPLFSVTEELLKTLPKGKSGLLFEYNKDYVTHKFKQFCPNHKLHDLRHTFATKCMEAGIPLKVVQVWLGHSNIEITADTYSHVRLNYSLLEATKADAAFKMLDTQFDT